jgi:predicted RNase H-like nuclease (RuvC/YqgF family)|tara:strand:- start:840 stop:1220 length:381 start_codon:yes stop_codon:yes gene_type:complete
MLSKERLITYGIIFILLSTLIYFVFLGDEEYVKDYGFKIEALEAKVDSLHSINDNLVFKIDTLNQKIVILDQEIDQQDNKIVTLKYKVNEKVNNVDFFNDSELERFFTERYKESDSIKNTNSKISN